MGKAVDTASPGYAVLSRRREPPDVSGHVRTRDSKVGMGFGAGAHCESTMMADGEDAGGAVVQEWWMPRPTPPPRLSARFRARLGFRDPGAVAAALTRGRSAHKRRERVRGQERVGRVEMERPRSANRLVHASPRPWEAAACRRRLC